MARGRGATRVAAALVAVVLATVVAPVARAADDGEDERLEMLRLLGEVRSQGTAFGAGLTFGDGEQDVTLSSGTRRLLANEPIRPSDRVRVGSSSKMFVASVVLQLVAEGRLGLDDRLEQHLPGTLRYPAGTLPGDPADFDGRAVTVRQLLRHTAGVPDYADIGYILDPLHQVDPPTPRELVAHAVPNGPLFAPGTGYRYSNTGYVLLGLVVEAVAGRTIQTEIAERIVEPLGLDDTFLPVAGDRGLHGEHVRGYLASTVPVDVTHWEPAVYGAAGGVVSSADDMITFLTALLDGEVVPPDLLALMQDDRATGAQHYGLGLAHVELSCGDAWGHGGFVPGYQTLGLAMRDGRHAFFTMNSTVAVALLPPIEPVSATELFELALC